MEKKIFTEKESLELISQMIQTSQNKLSKGDGLPFLLWGYATLIGTFAVWLALHITTGNPNSYWLWLLIPAIGGPASIIISKRLAPTVKTYIENTLNYVWLVITFASAILTVLAFLQIINTHMIFIVLLLMGSGTTITGFILKFKPLIICGFAAMIISPVYYLLPLDFTTHLLFFGLVISLMMIIPSHILICSVKKSCSKG